MYVYMWMEMYEYMYGHVWYMYVITQPLCMSRVQHKANFLSEV